MERIEIRRCVDTIVPYRASQLASRTLLFLERIDSSSSSHLLDRSIANHDSIPSLLVVSHTSHLPLYTRQLGIADKMPMEARILYLHQKTGWGDLHEWHIPDAMKFGIPLSDHHAHRVPPDLFDVDSKVQSILASVLSSEGTMSGW